MTIWSTIKVALRALQRNKLRSFLTTLGVIIGVAAVIAMVAIGEGAKAKVEQQFAAMGSNMLIVMTGSTRSGGVMGGFGSMPTLTWDDLRAIQTEAPSVRYAAAVLRSTMQVASEDQNWSTAVTGVAPDYFDIRSWGMSSGARFSTSDVDTGAKVCILGQTVVNKLFGPASDPVGQMVRIKNVPFQIVAVMEKKGQSGMGMDYDDVVFIPISTYLAKIQGGLRNYISGMIFVSTDSLAQTAKAEIEIRNLLRDRHNIRGENDDDFSIRNLSEMASAQQEGTRTLTTLLASVAAVSLLVGGIGIMNIMLVSVTERTREIGLRMAIGAKGRQILAQFLVEALVLSVLGGLMGVALGLTIAFGLARQFGWQTLVRGDIVVLSVTFSAVVGIVFGLYPARKASQLDPIEALRYE